MENIQKLYSLISEDKNIKNQLQNIQEKLIRNELNKEEADKFIFQVLLPLAQKERIDFSLDNLIKYENKPLELSEDDLKAVVGGISKPMQWGLSGLLLASSVAVIYNASIFNEDIASFFSGGQSVNYQTPDGKTDFSKLKEVGKEINLNMPMVTLPHFDATKFDLTKIKQDNHGDCYAFAVIESILNARPHYLLTIAERNPDDSVKVRIFTKDQYHKLNPYFLTVSKTPARAVPSSNDSVEADVFVEAIIRGGGGTYEKGSVATAFEIITGKYAQEILIQNEHPDQIFTQIKDIVAAKNPIVVNTIEGKSTGTKGIAGENIFTTKSGKKIVCSHSYAILGIKLVDDQVFVILKNPWGSNPDSPDDDGIIELEFSELLQVTHSINFVSLT
ncbi:MAG: hypothetical protein LBJ95_00750 [Oscillospiraceae bacterium]|jgi:hypothetical protein|nr:hypothetical protein [Oscillospiraceae bacterium]